MALTWNRVLSSTAAAIPQSESVSLPSRGGFPKGSCWQQAAPHQPQHASACRNGSLWRAVAVLRVGFYVRERLNPIRVMSVISLVSLSLATPKTLQNCA